MNAIAHGVDIVEVSRIEAMIERHPERFLDRCFTPGEQRYCDASTKRYAEHYAARFAVKESVLKALGTGWRSGIAWTDVEVIRRVSGEPGIALNGIACRRAHEAGIRAWLVSISHTRALAIASVIGLGESALDQPPAGVSSAED